MKGEPVIGTLAVILLSEEEVAGVQEQEIGCLSPYLLYVCRFPGKTANLV
ncbi:MAG: hypothetical protein JW984_03480 [Deltaproteobacteria bacterium]|uniref:Uncharacterized protein n=1 Tax=Candidatus Zymogenus saltonus TaxID=2844893 RepID=A0A9D8KD22_9DELT|nr:hypothetical protein [Candidatus Zymogenus saltonus]